MLGAMAPHLPTLDRFNCIYLYACLSNSCQSGVTDFRSMHMGAIHPMKMIMFDIKNIQTDRVVTQSFQAGKLGRLLANVKIIWVPAGFDLFGICLGCVQYKTICL